MRRRHWMTGLAGIATGLCLGACADDEPSDETDALAITDAPPRFAVALGGTPERADRRETGLLIEVFGEGEGAPLEPGQTGVIRFEMRLNDGTVLDSSERRRGFLSVPLVEGRAIPGLRAGLEGMRVGGARRIVVPPALAYGAVGRPPVPPDAELVFDVELVEIAPAE